ncbi:MULTISPECIES: DUF4340 domain-containing protein [unclassified Oceanispirochaeta]|uniref:DUF4340 domain-containing protein n=1 Tax=unclassified Oceanispirochaeta TaxID=2635722 RepID=UPI000E0909D2|nr:MULTISPECIES: DUF4340 domain-containing protein [unclassified Oceanispirochaeta]MBF9018730.1 DUF4340 domain-containing protein [Oceanispirochaeta sp. M2]NPD75160.1 DUF4340 domain-containing protein [Oceanispirochaeta sp. M1]RDG28981.1 DUF4340 domain-containing protein [Oceanispirochaeta sp. M1]
MKKKKQLIIALAALILLGAGYFLMPLLGGDKEEPQSSNTAARESYVLTDVAEDNFNSLTIENRFGKYTMIPTENGITLKDSESMVLNQQTAGALSYGLRNLTSFEKIEENSSSLEGYGLNSPSGILTVTLSDDSTLQIILGKAAPSGSGYYTMKEGENTVYLLSSYMAGSFLNSVDLLRDRTLPQVNFQNLKRLTIKGERIIDIVPYFPYEVFSSSLSPLLMVKPYKRPTAVNTQTYSENLEAFVKNYHIIDFIEEGTVETGLKNPAAALYMKDGEGAELSIEFGNRTEDGSAVYSRISGIGGVITLPVEAAKITEVKAIEMTDRFVRLISIDHISEVRVEYGDELWVGGIRWIDEDTGEFTFQGESVEEDPFKKMYQEILYLLFEGEIPEPFSPRGKAEFMVSYIGDDKSPGKTTAEFYSYNQDYYAVSIDGYAPEFLIGKYQVESLVQFIRNYAG